VSRNLDVSRETWCAEYLFLATISECVQRACTQAAVRASQAITSVVRARERNALLLGESPHHRVRADGCGDSRQWDAPHPFFWGAQGGRWVGSCPRPRPLPCSPRSCEGRSYGYVTTSRRTAMCSVTHWWHSVPSEQVSAQRNGRRGVVPARGSRSMVLPSRSRMSAAKTFPRIRHPRTSPRRGRGRPCMCFPPQTHAPHHDPKGFLE
jgi:hypothetical protein